MSNMQLYIDNIADMPYKTCNA